MVGGIFLFLVWLDLDLGREELKRGWNVISDTLAPASVHNLGGRQVSLLGIPRIRNRRIVSSLHQ